MGTTDRGNILSSSLDSCFIDLLLVFFSLSLSLLSLCFVVFFFVFVFAFSSFLLSISTQKQEKQYFVLLSSLCVCLSVTSWEPTVLCRCMKEFVYWLRDNKLCDIYLLLLQSSLSFGGKKIVGSSRDDEYQLKKPTKINMVISFVVNWDYLQGKNECIETYPKRLKIYISISFI